MKEVCEESVRYAMNKIFEEIKTECPALRALSETIYEHKEQDKTECELHEQHDVQLQTQLQIKNK